MYGWHWDGHMGWGWMGLWWIVAAAALLVVLWAGLRATRPGSPAGGGEPPEAIVKRRYARGEIDRETYERMLADLRR